MPISQQSESMPINDTDRKNTLYRECTHVNHATSKKTKAMDLALGFKESGFMLSVRVSDLILVNFSTGPDVAQGGPKLDKSTKYIH